MSVRRLSARAPSARALGTATLHGYQLRFHKIGRDGSGKCDIATSESPADQVIGVLFDIADSDRAALDHAEDLGRGYTRRALKVTTDRGSCVEVFTYTALLTDASLRPFDWYLRHVLTGAIEHRLPEEYIAIIRSTETHEDPDQRRRSRELGIYLDEF